MKRFIALILAIVLCISMPLFSFAYTSLDGVADVAWFPEPPELPNVLYWILDDCNGNSSGYSAFIFVLTFPYVSEEQFINGEIQVDLICEQSGQTLRVIAPQLEGVAFNLLIYRLNGTYLNRYDWTIPNLNQQPFTYTFTFASEYRYIWTKGHITPQLNNIYHLASIYFLEDYTYSARLTQIYNTLNTIGQLTAAQTQLLSSYISAFDAFFTMQESKLNTIQEQLNSIGSQLEDIKDLLGDDSTTVSYPDQSENASNASEVHSIEDNYYNDFNGQIGNVEDYIDTVESELPNIGFGFLAIRNLLNTYVFDNAGVTLLIIIALLMGVITLILRRVKA